jgi:hypothetical protein
MFSMIYLEIIKDFMGGILMSGFNKSEVLAKLTKLQGHLNELESANNEIALCEAEMKRLEKQKADPNLLPTNHYSSKYNEISNKKAEHRTRRYFITIGLVFLGICLLMLVFSEVLYVGPDWSTPEIVGEYSGSFSKYYSTMNANLNITSCNKRGEIEGTFEYFGEEDTLFDDLYAKFSIEGKVQKKGENGEVIAIIEFDEWIERPGGEYPLDDMEIKIYDNYSTVQNLDYEMILCTKGKEIPTDFVSPEIESVYQEDGGEDKSFRETIAIVFTLSYFVFVVIFAIVVFGMKPILNKEQKKILADLAQLDKDNRIKNDAIIKEAEQDFAGRKSRELSQYKSRINSARQRVSQYEKLCDQADIVTDRFKTLRCVNYLIDQLSSGLADSLKEALNHYEDYMRRMNDDFILQQKEWWARQNQAQALANLQNEQASHNYHVREELKKQTREMEEINERLKDLDN